ncbi:MAG: polysaccharide lyase family 7 protein [Nonlabens sp.]
MKNLLLYSFGFLAIGLLHSCEDEESEPDRIQVVDPNAGNTDGEVDIDFTNWKVTLPVDVNNDGSPDEYAPSQLINGRYRNLGALDGWMYDDEYDEGIIFHTTFVPGGATTTNSPYPRTELRELINPSNSRDNWTLQEGGILRMRMEVQSATDNYGSGSLDKDRFIVAQIHGIIKQSDVQRLGLSSDAAPPLLKMQWRDGDLYAFKKNLRDETMSGDDIITKSNDVWGDITHNFGAVGYDPFDLEIKASTGKLEVTVNGQTHIFQDVSLARWPFEDYFKAGVYMQSTDARSEATVKMYSLEVSH